MSPVVWAFQRALVSGVGSWAGGVPGLVSWARGVQRAEQQGEEWLGLFPLGTGVEVCTETGCCG